MDIYIRRSAEGFFLNTYYISFPGFQAYVNVRSEVCRFAAVAFAEEIPKLLPLFVSIKYTESNGWPGLYKMLILVKREI